MSRLQEIHRAELRQREDEFRDELQHKEAQLQHKNEELQQTNSDISRLQREIERLQVCIRNEQANMHRIFMTQEAAISLELLNTFFPIRSCQVFSKH